MKFNPEYFLRITAVVLIPITILGIIDNLKSIRVKKYSTFTGSYPVSKLSGKSAQIAAFLMLLMTAFVLIESVLFLTFRYLFIATYLLIFNSKLSIVIISFIFSIFFLYGYLTIFKDQNLKKMKNTKSTLHLFGRKIF